MIFGSFNCADAEGIILAHTMQTQEGKLQKGLCLTSTNTRQLEQAGYCTITGTKLNKTDVRENDAARQLANLIAGKNVRIGEPTGGRCRLYATKAGLAQINKPLIDAINQFSGNIAIATLNELASTKESQAVASIKVLPFAIEQQEMKAYNELFSHYKSGVALSSFQALNVVLLQTGSTSTKYSLQTKARRVTQQRIEHLGGTLLTEFRCQHSSAEIENIINDIVKLAPDLIIIAGEKATVDKKDVIPQAITNVGGAIDHFGMPAEPGNLLLLAHIDKCAIIVQPGCARTVHANGVDVILPRIFAGLELNKNDIMLMGVGGLLKDQREVPSWCQQPITTQKTHSRVGALILAAGRSTRMGSSNKLLAPLAGQPMVSHVIAAAKNANLATITLITGHDSDKMDQLFAHEQINIIYNPDYASGMASSLRRGLTTIDKNIDAVLVLLGDMPFVSTKVINSLVEAFYAAHNVGNGLDIVAPMYGNKRGNPVLWSVRYLDELRAIKGDTGGRYLLNKYAHRVAIVATEEDGSIIDIDTPQVLVQWQETATPTLPTIKQAQHL